MPISVITAEDMRARGVTDLRTALALLPDAGVSPGGDAGPAGAVPGLFGLREADDFLLLIDGVPAGGAFTPPFEAISLNNVERIEVIRGSAPVYFGTTAFAGTVNVIHYRAGNADPTLTLSYGSFGTVNLSGARVLSTGPLRQSIALEGSHSRMSGRRTGFDRAQASYRMEANLGDGQARLDLNLLRLDQKPGSPTPVGDDGQLRDDVPNDLNQNPADARLNTRRSSIVLGYDQPVAIGTWGTTLALTQTNFEGIQGFLVDGGLDLPGDNATGTRLSRQLRDLFFDTHITSRLSSGVSLTWGANELLGRAHQDSDVFSYRVPPDGSPPPDSFNATPTDQFSLTDWRNFSGVYAQSRIVLSATSSLLAGLRWNHTIESRRTSESGNALLDESQSKSRLSGSLGARWRVWRDPSGDLDDVDLYANWSNTFQPPQLDFGADAADQPLLRPETQNSFTFGAKFDGDDGRLDLDVGAFMADFGNQAVTRQINGLPVLQNGGSKSYQGVEMELAYRPIPALALTAHASYSESKYRDFTTLVGTSLTALDGDLVPLTPRVRAGAGIAYSPAKGWGASLTANYAGPRYLDSLNTARVGGFSLIDGSLAYRFDRSSLSLSVSNLSNRRDPVQASELGDGQIYRMQGRRALLSFSVRLP